MNIYNRHPTSNTQLCPEYPIIQGIMMNYTHGSHIQKYHFLKDGRRFKMEIPVRIFTTITIGRTEDKKLGWLLLLPVI